MERPPVMSGVRKNRGLSLTTGIIAREAVPTGSAAAMANGAVESFVISAAGELPPGIRLDAVSPSVLASAPGYHDAFPGFEPVTDEAVGRAFVRLVEGITSGTIYKVD